MIYRVSEQSGRLHQGEIVSNLTQARLSLSSIGQKARPKVDRVEHPYAVVVTQDCDLEADYMVRSGQRTSGSPVPSVLFCEVATAEELRTGSEIKSDIWRRLRGNKDERYHYLRGVGPENDARGEGTLDLAIDFKRFFTVPTDEVYRRLELNELQRRACLTTPYREHLSTRFFYYHYRIALPQEHFLSPAAG